MYSDTVSICSIVAKQEKEGEAQMKRRRHQNIQEKWNGDKKWDKWSNKSIWRALLTWLLLSSALIVPVFVVNAILPTLFQLAEYGPILLRFAYATLALCALIPFEAVVWRLIRDLFFRI